MPRKKGEPKTGGRKKGTPNKTTSSAKQNILAVFEGIGDIGGMITWARANRTDFYKLYARLLPHEMSGPGGGPIPSDDEPLDYEDMARRLLFVLEGATYKMAILKAAKAVEATGNATKKAATKEDVIAKTTEDELEVPPSAPTLPWVDPDE